MILFAYIDTGLELVRIVGLVRRIGSTYNLHIKDGPTEECRSSFRCLSQFLSYEMEIYQLLMVL